MRLFKFIVPIVLFGITAASCNKYAKIQKSNDVEYKLRSADSLYSLGKYKIAQEIYEELFPVYKGSKKFEELYFKSSMTYFHLKMYRESEQWFKGFAEVFPNSVHTEEARFMQAYSVYKQSPKVELEQVQTGKAMNLLQSFITSYPNSIKKQEATDLIDKLRLKLEEKDARTAKLYYNLGYYKAAALAYDNLLINYAAAGIGDDYKLMAIKSYYKYAGLSIEDKQIERYEQVISAYEDFLDRFPESKLLKEAESYSNNSKNKIKKIQDEQATSSAKR